MSETGQEFPLHLKPGERKILRLHKLFAFVGLPPPEELTVDHFENMPREKIEGIGLIAAAVVNPQTLDHVSVNDVNLWMRTLHTISRALHKKSSQGQAGV